MEESQLRKSFNYYALIIANLALGDLKIRYKQTCLRFAWALLQPLTNLLIFAIVFSRIIKVSSEGTPYLLFSYCALLPWNFFATCFLSATTCMQKNVNLITRVNFPKITIPLSAIVASLLDFLISFAILIILMCYYKVGLNITMLFLVPIFLIQLIFTVGVVLIMVTLTMYIKDFEQAASFIIRLGMLISPVGYSLQMIPGKFINFYLLNPMASLLDSYRKVLLHQALPNFEYLSIGFFVSLVILIFGFWFFKKGEPAFVDML